MYNKCLHMRFATVGIIAVALIGLFLLLTNASHTFPLVKTSDNATILTPTAAPIVNPLQIEQMRKKEYPGSDITIEDKLSPGSNYNQYIASYKSEGLKIYALLTVPIGDPPKGGFPTIIFNHGYIPPEQYKTTERYIAYVDGFARKGYVVFKSDYRGNGNSEGNPEGTYYSPSYTTDVLNALSSIKKYPNVNPDKIGMYGHSMGGNITLRSMVVSKDIKVGVIWGGVVATYQNMAQNWHRRSVFSPSQRELNARRPGRVSLIAQYGDFDKNPSFWNSVSPNYYVSDISGPVQLHHGLSDEEVPPVFSQELYNQLLKAGKTAEYYTYQGADHNISGLSFTIAMNRSIAFFDKYLK